MGGGALGMICGLSAGGKRRCPFCGLTLRADSFAFGAFIFCKNML